jgi:glycosyltransferase involved in cell wall biosynthesis
MKFSSDPPMVSLIILCYNQAHLVSRAIESVLNQTYENIQLVIVDDGSKDDSLEVIQEWKKKYPEKIKIFIQPRNLGHPASMNTGYSLCDGELVTFCDGDDWYFPEKIEREVNYLREHPDVDVVHSNFDFYTVEGKFVRHWALEEKNIPTGDIFLQLFSLAYPFRAHFRYEMTSKSILEQTGFYDPDIPIWVDWDLRLRLASKYKFGYCHYVGSAYTENPGGLTNVLKQETILEYLQFVINKNKHVLKKYPEVRAYKARKAINLTVKKLTLAINLHKGNASFFKTLIFLWEYPAQLIDIKFVLNSMFGKRFMQILSGIKRKFKILTS